MLEWCKVLLLFKTQGKKKQNITKQRLGRTYCKAVNHHQRKKKKKKPAPEEQGNKTSVPQHWGKGLQPSRHRWIVSQ